MGRIANRFSDKVYNVRKRAKRALQRAQKLGKTKLAALIQTEIKKTYYDKGTHTYIQGIKQVLDNLSGMIGQVGVGQSKKRIARSNKAFLNELNKAAKGNKNSITSRTGFSATQEVNVFFAATRDLWEYVPGGNEHPLETVAGILHMDRLEDAYRYVMHYQKEALNRIDALANGNITGDLMKPSELSFDERYMDVMARVNVMR